MILSGYRACRDVGFWAVTDLVETLDFGSLHMTCRDMGFWAVTWHVETWEFGLLQGLKRSGVLEVYRVTPSIF